MKKILVMVMAVVITTMAAASEKNYRGVMFEGPYEFCNNDTLEIQYYDFSNCTYVRVWKTEQGKIVEILYPTEPLWSEAQG